MNIEQIIKQLNLEPLDIEGGFFKRTYTSADIFNEEQKIASAIYFVITQDDYSALHKLQKSDEMFHFYFGDPVEMLLLHENGKGERVIMSNHPGENFHPQQLVPKNTWQGTRLKPGGSFAILGVTVFPEFLYEDFVISNADELIRQYPNFAKEIRALTKKP